MITRQLAFYSAVLSVVVGVPGLAVAQGIVVPGVGPINRSMAGAAVAAPIDAAGAMHWNPAAISGLRTSQMLFSVEFLAQFEPRYRFFEPAAPEDPAA